MSFHVNENISNTLKGQYLLLDNDFLAVMFSDEKDYSYLVKLLASSYMVVDQLTVFEFLRDIYVPEQRQVREKFIANDQLFLPTPKHSDIFSKIQDNALILSKIYAHHRNKHGASPSLVDLFLAARVMLTRGKYLIITGNKRDYPNILFDTVEILTLESADGSLQPFAVLKFNLKNFNELMGGLEALEK